jgi:hypothetical protein
MAHVLTRKELLLHEIYKTFKRGGQRKRLWLAGGF